MKRLAAIAMAALLQAPALAQMPEEAGFQALPGEAVVIPQLRGIVTVDDAAQARLPAPAAFSGIDTSRTPLLRDPAAEEMLRLFLGHPASLASLERIAIAVRTWLRASGQPFVTAYLPAQEVSDGVVRIVVLRARLAGELKVEGAQHFPESAYREGVAAAPGMEIDARALADHVERLNENPFRRATLAAEAGEEPGTTRLVMRVQDEFPWRFSAGYNNAGTVTTDEDRVFASVLWGDAFGRGDQLGYAYNADPHGRHSRSHSGHYTAFFRGLDSLTLYGSYSEVASIQPEPLTQEGTSWQLGGRYTLPRVRDAGGWRTAWSFSGDFKYSDNTIEFALIPVTGNVTHIVQAGARVSASRQAEGRGTAFSASAVLSPGDLSDENTDEAFAAARFGAKARYAYARADLQHVGALPEGFSWMAAVSLQLASGPLLGSEQVNGGGSTGVRGYREGTAYGDDGAILNTELRLPSFSLLQGRDLGVLLAFVDWGVVRNRGADEDSTRLASAGVGLNYQVGRSFSLVFRYGWPLEGIPATRFARESQGHVNATISF